MASEDERPRRVIGVMTGTSIDGLDAALVSIHGRGRELRARLVRHAATPLGAASAPLRAVADQARFTAGELAQLSLEFGVLHADAVEGLLGEGSDREPIDLVAAHGQTVFHDPPVSWQLLDPTPIADRLGAPVVCDLRQADLVAGGEGAPLTPLADWVLFRTPDRRRVIVNLGGFANATFVPCDTGAGAIEAIRGLDICACNQLLDAVAREGLGAPFDRDGAAAASGAPNADDVRMLESMLREQRRAGRSLGTGDEARAWIGQALERLEPPDLAASAVTAVASCIADAVNELAGDEVIVAGGGVANRALMNALAQGCAAPVVASDELGVPACAREAMAFAVLGTMALDGADITLPAVTGRQRPAVIAGRWTFPPGWAPGAAAP